MSKYDFVSSVTKNQSEKEPSYNRWSNPDIKPQAPKSSKPEQNNEPVQEPYRVTDAYWSPARVVQEQQNFVNDPNYVSPSGQTREVIDATANYITGKTGYSVSGTISPGVDQDEPQWMSDDGVWTSSVSKWSIPKEEPEDPGKIIPKQAEAVQEEEQETVTPQASQVAPEQQTPAFTVEQQLNDIIEKNPWMKSVDVDKSNADVSQQNIVENLQYNFMPGTGGTDVRGATGDEKYTQGIMTSVMSGAGVGGLAKLGATALGSSKAGAIGFFTSMSGILYSYLRSIGATEGWAPADWIMEKTDALDDWSQQQQGRFAYAAGKAGVKDITDAGKFYQNLKTIANNWDKFTEAWNGINKEYDPAVVKFVTGLTANMGANVIGFGNAMTRGFENILYAVFGEDRFLEKGQTTRSNSGLSGVYDLDIYGQEALTYWLNFSQTLIDSGMTEKDMESVVIQKMMDYYGDLFNWSEIFEHEAGDLGNMAEGMQPRVMTAYGTVIHDPNLVNASKSVTGNIFYDMAGQVPGLQGAIETVGRVFNKEVRGSGGIDDVIQAWDLENKLSPESNLTALDRRFSQIDKSGKIKGVATPNTDPHTVKNPLKRAFTHVKNFFSETNEWKATYEGDAIFDVIDAGVEDAISARGNEDPTTTVNRVMQFVDELQHPENISEGSPFEKMAQTPLFKSIQDDIALAVSSRRGQIEKNVRRFLDLEENRQVLNTVSNALGIKPNQVLSMFDSQPTVLTQMIINKADENGGKIPGIDIPVEGREFGEEVINRIRPFTGRSAQAWDVRQLMLQLTTNIADGVTETLVNKYNFKPDAMPFRFADSIKKMQNLLLLGLSPSYLANNILNNAVTRSAIGYGGYMSGKMMNSFMDRFGYKPSRWSEATDEYGFKKIDEVTNADRLQKAIKDKKKVKDLIQKVSDTASWTSEKFGLFGNLSGLVEENESRQIMTSAMMTYLARSWKPGVNFRKMPARLEAIIRDINPGMVDAIYSAVRAGVNMDEIEQAIFGAYVAPSVRDTLLQSAQNVGIKDAEDFIVEVFDKGGMMEQLNTALKGRQCNEIDAIINDFAKKLKADLQVQLASDLTVRAEAIKKMTRNEGFATAIDLANEISDQMLEVWLGSQDGYSRLFEMRVQENLSTQEFRRLMRAQQERTNERWQGIYATAKQTYEGILEGIGMGNRNIRNYLKYLGAKQQVWVDFYAKQDKHFRKYLASLAFAKGEEFASWDARVKQAWKEYNTAMSTEYSKALTDETNAQQKMDEAFVKGLYEALGKANTDNIDTKIAPKLEEIRNKRAEISELNRETRRQANQVKLYSERNIIYNKAESKLKQLKEDQARLQHELYAEIKNIGPLVVNVTDTDVMTQDEMNTIIDADIAKTSSQAEQEVAKEFSDRMVDKILDNEEEGVDTPVTDATSPQDWSMELHRDNLRQTAVRAGYTIEQADYFARLMGAYAKAWENRHPGQDYFEANKIHINFYQQERFADGNVGMYQIDWGVLDSWQNAKRGTLEYYMKEAYNNLRGSTTDRAIHEAVIDGRNEYFYNKLIPIIMSEMRNNPRISGKVIGNTIIKTFAKSTGENYYEKFIDPNYGDLTNAPEKISSATNDALNDLIGDFSYSNMQIYDFTGLRDFYQFHHDSLYDLAIRSGADEDTALAFSAFTILVAEKWNNNNPGKNFFTDGMGDPNWRSFLNVAFINGVDPNAKAQYSKKYKKISVFKDGDLFSLSHEIFHGMEFILNEEQSRKIAKYFNIPYDRYIYLRDNWGKKYIKTGKKVLSNDESAFSTDISEKLARGYVDYLANGNYPAELEDIFLTFQNFAHELYKWDVGKYIVGTSMLYKPESNNPEGKYELISSRDKANGVTLEEIMRLLTNNNREKIEDAKMQARILQQRNRSRVNSGSLYQTVQPAQATVMDQESNTQQQIKGEFRIEDGQRIVNLFKGNDLSTLVHETMGHGFASTLDNYQVEALAAYNGWTLQKYRQLEFQWYNAPESMSEADRQAWVDAQEKFAYGFEQYLLEGKAPNSIMAQVFEAFKNFLLEIYKSVRDLIYKGEEIDIHAEQNGVSLIQIFESMLDGYQGQEQTQFNIDTTNLTMAEGENQSFGQVTDESYGSVINDENREFFQSESDKQWEKYNALKKSAEDKLKNDTAKYVSNIEKRYKLSTDESMEMVVEIMHALGLNQDVQENDAMKASLDQKWGEGKREKKVRDFIRRHRQDAVKISDEAIRKYMDDISSDPEYFPQWRALYAYYQKEQQVRSPETTLKHFNDGKAVFIDNLDLSKLKGVARKDTLVRRLAEEIVRFMKDKNKKQIYSVDEVMDFITDAENQKGEPRLTESQKREIGAKINENDKNGDIATRLSALRNDKPAEFSNAYDGGTFVIQTQRFKFGNYNIAGAVYHNGELVAYVPEGFQYGIPSNSQAGQPFRIIGYSPKNPENPVYLYNGDVHEVDMAEALKTDPEVNPLKGEMEQGSMPGIDPTAQASHEITYDKTLKILENFRDTYKQNLDNAMAENNYSKLTDEGKSLLRGYIDHDVRTDLMNTKYKAIKFGEMMRDSALLNYSHRYGFDNFLTMIAPYQFWQTRSFYNWISRLSSKGGRLWRRYARLKELEERNKKEFMPSRVSGKWGMYINGLPDWMGDSVLMPTDQLFVVGNFLDPIYDYASGKNSIIATAEKYLLEELEDKTISGDQYERAMNPETRNESPEWQQAYAKAQTEDEGNNGFGNLMSQYFGFSLPVSTMKAVMEGKPVNQFPMTRSGNAWRALIGDNFVGKAGQAILSAPERAIRSGLLSRFGEKYAYNEFGNWGDYYIRGQVWDMAIEGLITAEDAMQATLEKDGNKYWDMGAERQRQELLLKTQGFSALAPVKQMGQDLIKKAKGEEVGDDTIRDDFLYMLAGISTALLPKTVVRESERERRRLNGELSEAFKSDDENAVNKFYDENPMHSYSNIRYEDDDEQAFRKYLYTVIKNAYYDMDEADRKIVRASMDGFEERILDKETRAIETMNLDDLLAYAQTLTGSVPYLATDKFNTTNVQSIPLMPVPQEEKDAYTAYMEIRERDYPGMASVSNQYWKLPAESREEFLKYNPAFDAFLTWDDKYKKDHEEVKSFNSRVSDYYDIREAGQACALFDEITMNMLRRHARTDKKPDKDYESLIKEVMREVETTKDYDKFVNNIMNFILGE